MSKLVEIGDFVQLVYPTPCCKDETDLGVYGVVVDIILMNNIVCDTSHKRFEAEVALLDSGYVGYRECFVKVPPITDEDIATELRQIQSEQPKVKEKVDNLE